jgi:16S rRNA C967 or C1407 C5-methylase (RsmB/RsmF family)
MLEYPVDHLTLKDLYTLKRQQTACLKHAFKFPKVKNVVYLTRSTHSEENEQVVTDTLGIFDFYLQSNLAFRSLRR